MLKNILSNDVLKITNISFSKGRYIETNLEILSLSIKVNIQENIMSMYSHQKDHNIIRDYDKAQGTTHPADLSYQIIRDYNIRYITVENSAVRPMGVAITTYLSGPTPPILFTLAAGEIKHLGINTHGGPPQYIWILSVQSLQPIGNPCLIPSNSNQLVIRDGLNKAFIQYFYRPSYAAAK